MSSSSHQILRTNIQKQLKRLLSQLQQLQTLRQQLQQQQYDQLKKSTLQQLQIFQQSLDNMIKDPNNSMLESQLQKTKRLIFQTIKQKFNKDQIKGKILEGQVKGLRLQIKQIDRHYNMKKINIKQYSKKKRNLIVKLQQAGVQLTKQQNQWLKIHQSFSQQQQQEYQNVQESEMKKAQQNIKNEL